MFILAASMTALALLFVGDARAQASPAELVAAMQEGGKVVFLRHGVTNANEIDTGRLDDRVGQRNLSPAGIAQARALGEAFRVLGISLDRILASPVFRARDTAELAFGANRIEITMDIVADDYADGDVQRMVTASRRHLRTPPQSGSNTLLIGHRTPLQMVTGRRFPDTIFPEGAMAVFDPSSGEAVLVGTLTAEDLIAASGI